MYNFSLTGIVVVECTCVGSKVTYGSYCGIRVNTIKLLSGKKKLQDRHQNKRPEKMQLQISVGDTPRSQVYTGPGGCGPYL